uniref:SHC-transforming protein 4 n=1 Tax=Oryzias sinensis TaxID=183150 RepID=A0A8C8E1V4_9TELE
SLLFFKYMGSVEVTQSMRTLDFETRMQVTREAISRLCEKTAVKTKRAASKGPSAVLGEINMQFSGSKAILTVSTNSVTLMAASTLQRIAHHPMQAISFASGGDPDMTDYVAYVAKDLFNKRACHILECPHGRASEVLNSIGQAFEARFRQLLSQTSTLLSTRLFSRWSGLSNGLLHLMAETGAWSRKKAESLLTCSGDFLVRESSSASGQYVLSGMEGATVRHLLLVDPHGQVRTRDLVFQSVGHLVRFHMEKQLPIISGSSELCLKQPILQTH